MKKRIAMSLLTAVCLCGIGKTTGKIQFFNANAENSDAFEIEENTVMNVKESKNTL